MTMSHFSIVACVVAILQGVSQEATKNSHICPQYNTVFKKLFIFAFNFTINLFKT